MKKLLCLLLTLAMMLSLAACGSKADDKTPEEDDPTQAETNIADKQDEPAADDVDKGRCVRRYRDRTRRKQGRKA
ncbi:MAG: hypothetical protein V8T17_06215 [Oscillospiraceae bacterium]